MRFALLCLLTFLAVADPGLPVLVLPFGNPAAYLVSPDGAWRLYGVPYRKGQNQAAKLWLENLRTHRRSRVANVADTLRAGWFPDELTALRSGEHCGQPGKGAAFWLEDHRASDRTESWVYDPTTLRRLDIRGAVLASDPSIALFDDGHRYYNVESAAEWSVIIDFNGHTDRAPVTCFDYRYRVTRAGKVDKLSGSAWLSSHGGRPCR